jgi:hypothetical protein
MRDTFLRAVAGATAAALVTGTVLWFLPDGGVLITAIALVAGAAAAIPMIWRELRLLMNL